MGKDIRLVGHVEWELVSSAVEKLTMLLTLDPHSAKRGTMGLQLSGRPSV